MIKCLYVCHTRLNDAHTRREKQSHACYWKMSLLIMLYLDFLIFFQLMAFYWQCCHMAAAAALVICLPCSMFVKSG